MDALDLVHGVRAAQRRGKGHADRPLWPWARNTAWRHVKAVMAAADIPEGPIARPRGHATLEVTAIHADALGAEERGIAARMWSA